MEPAAFERLAKEMSEFQDYAKSDEAYDRASTEARNDPKIAAEIAWTALTTLDASMGTAMRLFGVAVAGWGMEVAGKAILENWDSFSLLARRNICYLSHDPQLMCSKLVVSLFRNPSTHVHERHTLVLGLAVPERQQEEMVLKLLSVIGHYSSAHQKQQAQLEADIERAQKICSERLRERLGKDRSSDLEGKKLPEQKGGDSAETE